MIILERMARAMFRTAEAEKLLPGAHPAFDRDRDAWIAMVRAAVEEAREPTEEMLLDAKQSGEFSASGGFAGTTYDVSEVWKAMIDALLAEQPGDQP